MQPNEVNGLIPPDQSPRPKPLENGQVQTAEFMISGNLRAAYPHFKEMFDPPKVSTSGPIKPLTQAEKDREANAPVEAAVNEIPPTISG